VRRIVGDGGVGMWLPRQDGEGESVVMEDDAVLVHGVSGRARYAQAHVPKRRGHHRVPRVLQGWLLRHEELVGFSECFSPSFFRLAPRPPSLEILHNEIMIASRSAYEILAVSQSPSLSERISHYASQ